MCIFLMIVGAIIYIQYNFDSRSRGSKREINSVAAEHVNKIFGDLLTQWYRCSVRACLVCGLPVLSSRKTAWSTLYRHRGWFLPPSYSSTTLPMIIWRLNDGGSGFNHCHSPKNLNLSHTQGAFDGFRAAFSSMFTIGLKISRDEWLKPNY